MSVFGARDSDAMFKDRLRPLTRTLPQSAVRDLGVQAWLAGVQQVQPPDVDCVGLWVGLNNQYWIGTSNLADLLFVLFDRVRWRRREFVLQGTTIYMYW